MINSISQNKKETILFPGVVIFENAIDINDSDISDIYSVYNYMSDGGDRYQLDKVKNTFFYGLNIINRSPVAEKIQKSMLNCFARYCDIYKEVIHTIQWQENIFIDVEYAGDSSFIFNPNKSFMENNKIRNTPFSRQVVVEIVIDDDYEGGAIEWEYLNDIKINKINKGSILFYPANYLFSKKHNTIILGRRITLTTFLNGGKDFLAEENGIEDTEFNLLSSYMR
jgi:hypothetical protein